MQSDQPDYELQTIDAETRDHSLAEVVSEGDPEMMLACLEKKAALAGRFRQAIETVLVSQTYTDDWTTQGGKACLSSAGAERVGRSFPIRYRDVEWTKEESADEHGKWYRYLYVGYAELYDRVVYVHGSYSTRDKFLGFAGGEWRPVEEINEGHIRTAAYHVFCGNGVKELLGLRGIPADEYRRIMGATGRDAGKSSAVQRGKGTQGGSQASDDDKPHQMELAETCISFANAGFVVEQDGEGNWSLAPRSEDDTRNDIACATDICIQLSSFEGDKGPVKGKGAKGLKGKWLNSTLGKARKLKEAMERNHANE